MCQSKCCQDIIIAGLFSPNGMKLLWMWFTSCSDLQIGPDICFNLITCCCCYYIVRANGISLNIKLLSHIRIFWWLNKYAKDIECRWCCVLNAGIVCFQLFLYTPYTLSPPDWVFGSLDTLGLHFWARFTPSPCPLPLPLLPPTQPFIWANLVLSPLCHN